MASKVSIFMIICIVGLIASEVSAAPHPNFNIKLIFANGILNATMDSGEKPTVAEIPGEKPTVAEIPGEKPTVAKIPDEKPYEENVLFNNETSLNSTNPEHILEIIRWAAILAQQGFTP